MKPSKMLCCTEHAATFFTGGYCPVCGKLRTAPGDLNSQEVKQKYQELETERQGLQKQIHRVQQLAAELFERITREERDMLDAETMNEKRCNEST